MGLFVPALLSTARAAEPVFLLDPGHGGGDPGAKGPGGSESSFVLKTGLALESLLLEAGVPVKLTRRTDAALPPRSRYLAPAETEALFLISLHISGAQGYTGGARLYFVPAESAPAPMPLSVFLPWGPGPELSTRSHRLAEQLVNIAGLLGPRVFPLPGAPLESAKVPALILEMGGIGETTLDGGDLDPAAMASSWAPFLAQLWAELKP